tara:strand:- start:328 stop:633 length:306 start_codon:yes stop_codon:yes gene_type:complete
MQNLPLEIVNNILIIQYDEQINELKKQLKSLKFNHDTMEQHYDIMHNYLTSHEVKYCEECYTYGDDDEIIQYEEFDNEYLCGYCEEFKQEQKEERENLIEN